MGQSQDVLLGAVRTVHKRDSIQTFTFAAHEPFLWPSRGGPSSVCAEHRGHSPETLPAGCFWPERLQSIFSPFSGESSQNLCSSQCPCLLLSLCWVSSLGISSSIVPGGEAAQTCRLSRRGIPWGQELFPCSPFNRPVRAASAGC